MSGHYNSPPLHRAQSQGDLGSDTHSYLSKWGNELEEWAKELERGKSEESGSRDCPDCGGGPTSVSTAKRAVGLRLPGGSCRDFQVSAA